MSEVVAWIRAVPPTFWGVVIGSFFTLIGVAATNRGNTKRLERQLDHDREQRRIDREQQIRKEIYLAAAEAIAAGLLMIERVANVDIPDAELNADYAERVPALSKLYVVADAETMRAVERLTDGIMFTFTGLVLKRLRVTWSKLAMNQAEAIMKDRLRDSGRWVEIMTQENLSTRDPMRWNIIKNNYENAQQQAGAARIAHAEALTHFREESVVLMKLVQEKRLELMPLLASALMAVRRDLGFVVDETAIAEVMEASTEFQKKAIGRYLEEYESLLKGLTASTAPRS